MTILALSIITVTAHEIFSYFIFLQTVAVPRSVLDSVVFRVIFDEILFSLPLKFLGEFLEFANNKEMGLMTRWRTVLLLQNSRWRS